MSGRKGKSAGSAAPIKRQPDVAGGHCNTLQCPVVTAVMALVAERGASNTGGPEEKPAVWFEKSAQLAPLSLLSRAVGSVSDGADGSHAVFPVKKTGGSAAPTTCQLNVAGGHCNTLQCSVVTEVMAFVAARGTSNSGGPEGKPAVWFETLAQLAPLPLLSRAVGVGVGLR